jgi:hypothetical protein
LNIENLKAYITATFAPQLRYPVCFEQIGRCNHKLFVVLLGAIFASAIMFLVANDKAK